MLVITGGLTVIVGGLTIIKATPTFFSTFLFFPSFTRISNLASQDALDRGMVLVMSLWDDAEANMLWLDSDYPADKSPSIPGVNRGPCARDTGKPSFLRSKFPDARVTYSEIKVRDREVKQIFGKWKMWGLTKKCQQLWLSYNDLLLYPDTSIFRLGIMISIHIIESISALSLYMDLESSRSGWGLAGFFL